jgi:hypothetical protein
MSSTKEAMPPTLRPRALLGRLRRRLAMACALAAGLVPAAAAPAASITWAEVGDAGQTLGSAQAVTGNPGDSLTTITGSISSASDHDLFIIRITNGAAFSATTVGQPGTLDDTQLFLFNSAGIGVYANDDAANGIGANAFRSTLPAGGAPTTIAPGVYFLLIGASLSYPTSAGGLIFPNFTLTSVPQVDSTAVVGPIGPGGASPLTGYTGTAASFGTYQIALTGAAPAAVPEPASFVLLAAGALGIFAVSGLARSERRSGAHGRERLSRSGSI